MSGRHIRQPVSAASFDAQWEHSLRMGQKGPQAPLQKRVDDYIEARRIDRERAKRKQEVKE